jgi:hypothetical protein
MPAPYDTNLSMAMCYDKSANTTGWWISSNNEQRRVYWDGEKFTFENGATVSPPQYIASFLPNVPLDMYMYLDV